MILRCVPRSSADFCLPWTVVVENILMSTSSAISQSTKSFSALANRPRHVLELGVRPEVNTRALTSCSPVRAKSSNVSVTGSALRSATGLITSSHLGLTSKNTPLSVNVQQAALDAMQAAMRIPTEEVPLTQATTFRFDDYDCLGFDLDNTICRYKVSNMVKMEYDALSQYLVEKLGYAPKHLSRPIEENEDFMIKGLILDVKKGNVLRTAANGTILHGTHGTKALSRVELIRYYGPDVRWEVMDVFIRDPLHTWNGPLSETIRALNDYFDMPAGLVFARAVDTLDEANEGPLDEYHIYPHIIEALTDMFHREQFGACKGGYFPNIKQNPSAYIHKCSDALISWFKGLRQANKLLFLITGSNVDFATHTATASLGDDWRQLFDIVVCFAKKPGFFTMQRPFKALDGFVETSDICDDDLERGGVYTSGNWQGLYKFLAKHSYSSQPKVVYVGDHIIQDVYTPAKHTACDTVAICEELEAEGAFGHEQSHCDSRFLLSNVWGSYFQHGQQEVLWTDFMRKHAKIAVPSLEYVAKFPIDHDFIYPD